MTIRAVHPFTVYLHTLRDQPDDPGQITNAITYTPAEAEPPLIDRLTSIVDKHWDQLPEHVRNQIATHPNPYLRALSHTRQRIDPDPDDTHPAVLALVDTHNTDPDRLAEHAQIVTSTTIQPRARAQLAFTLVMNPHTPEDALRACAATSTEVIDQHAPLPAGHPVTDDQIVAWAERVGPHMTIDLPSTVGTMTLATGAVAAHELRDASQMTALVREICMNLTGEDSRWLPVAHLISRNPALTNRHAQQVLSALHTWAATVQGPRPLLQPTLHTLAERAGWSADEVADRIDTAPDPAVAAVALNLLDKVAAGHRNSREIITRIIHNLTLRQHPTRPQIAAALTTEPAATIVADLPLRTLIDAHPLTHQLLTRHLDQYVTTGAHELAAHLWTTWEGTLAELTDLLDSTHT